MGAFVAAPGKEEIDDGQASRLYGEADGVACAQVREVNVAASEWGLGGVGGEVDAEGKFG